ncbi:MAG: hypothetical protein NUW01_02145 [Gemmatimonadaceae bacterium]|nr:hypothetical protein [Gemmatimonadaceae bacterium]
MPHTRSLFLTAGVAAALLTGCGEREPEPRPPEPLPPAVVPSPPVAQLTGWPAGLGRALALRLSMPEESYRLIVPELGDRRFADSSISVKVGDSIPVILVGRRGNAGEALLTVVDAEAGTGACVTWPAVEIAGRSVKQRAGAGAWRVAVERDSVTPVAIDTLLGMPSEDSASLTRTIYSLVPDVTALTDSTLRGIPFAIRRAYALPAAGISIVAAELVRTSRSEADPREQRLFLVGERMADEQAHRLVFSSDITGRADTTPVTELLVAVVSRQQRRPILVLGVEGTEGMRVHLLQRVGRRQWRISWASVVRFC